MSKSKIIGSVIILANEDDAAHTIRPRLDAAGADTTKVYIVEGVAREGQQVDLFQLDTDIAALRLKAEEIGDVLSAADLFAVKGGVLRTRGVG